MPLPDLGDHYDRLLGSITSDELIAAHIAVPGAGQLREALANLCQDNIQQWTKRQYGLLLILNGLSCILSDEIKLED